MDGRDYLFAFECCERDGPIVRHVRFAPFTMERLTGYWEKLKAFPTLFNKNVENLEDFLNAFMSQGPNGELQARGIVFEVDDVGMLWLSDIYPEYQATGHFTFWDRRFRGREALIRKLLVYVFDEFKFHRIVAEVPLYSEPTVVAAERIGFVKEGRLRKAAWYKDEWWDVNIYSIFREEANGNSGQNYTARKPVHSSRR